MEIYNASDVTVITNRNGTLIGATHKRMVSARSAPFLTMLVEVTR